MARFSNKPTRKIGERSPIQSNSQGTPTEEARPDTRTHERGPGYTRSERSELFLLAVSFMGGDKNFYETEKDRYNRLKELVWQVSAGEQSTQDWILPFVEWLRRDVGLRTVSLVLGAEFARARPAHSPEGDARAVVSAALQRADEPAEMVGYWNVTYGGTMPRAMRMGIADSLTRIANPFNYLKYGKGSTSSVVAMRDVVRLTHPTPRDQDQRELFGYMTGTSDDEPQMMRLRKTLQATPRDERRQMLSLPGWGEMSNNAGITWEWISEWLPGGMDAEAWEAMIPRMGIFALLRNLRNFDQAGIQDRTVDIVTAKLMDPETIRNSGILPFQIYNAYRNLESVRWSMALDRALDFSVSNVPKFQGRTLVLVDMSGSMDMGRVSNLGQASYADVAKIFGAVLAARNPKSVDLYQYGSEWKPHLTRAYELHAYELHYRVMRPMHGGPPTEKDAWSGVTKRIEVGGGASPLTIMNKFHGMNGTRTHEAFAEAQSEIVQDGGMAVDRIILISDEQGWGTRYNSLPVKSNIPVYIWNLAGYRAGISPSGGHKRHTFGGLSDDAFKLIPILESGRDSGWPWEESGIRDLGI